MKNVSLLDKEDLKEAILEVILPLMKDMQYNGSKAAISSSKDDLLSRTDAAAFLKITLVTLNAWTRQGTNKLPRDRAPEVLV
jgi:hypothetical protein